MGLAGGFHCLAMCLVPCHGIIAAQSHPPTDVGVNSVHVLAQPPKAQEVPITFFAQRKDIFQAPAVSRWLWRTAGFHLGRLVGYALAGGMAAWAMGNLGLLSQSSALIQPLWSGVHALILVWGLAMLLLAKQPMWLERLGRLLWRFIQPLAAHRYGLVFTSAAWVFLPCGLLYSALLLAALTQSFWQGAGAMVAFGVGSGAWLVLGLGVWKGVSNTLRTRAFARWLPWGTRLAGFLLMLSASFALWMEWFFKPGLWCIGS